MTGQLGVVQVQVRLHELAQVGLDGRLVLRRRRHDAGGGDEAAGVERDRADAADPGRYIPATATCGSLLSSIA